MLIMKKEDFGLIKSRRGQAIFLRKVCGCTIKECAELMGITTRSVWMHLTNYASTKNVETEFSTLGLPFV
jgi:DNA-binding NarL/FixJ family response regulator